MKQKKNRKGGLLLVAALLLTCAAAGTVAKYQTTLSGLSTIQVAKFDVSASGLGKTQTTTLGLFDEIKDTNLAAETDVSTGKIAPGTSGYKEIELTNKSEVNVKAVMTATLTDNTIASKTVPIELAITDSTSTPAAWTAAGTDATETVDKIAYSPTPSIGTTQKKYLHWRWQYEQGKDADDTAIGEAATASLSPKVTLSVEFTQID